MTQREIVVNNTLQKQMSHVTPVNESRQVKHVNESCLRHHRERDRGKRYNTTTNESCPAYE